MGQGGRGGERIKSELPRWLSWMGWLLGGKREQKSFCIIFLTLDQHYTLPKTFIKEAYLKGDGVKKYKLQREK